MSDSSGPPSLVDSTESERDVPGNHFSDSDEDAGSSSIAQAPDTNLNEMIADVLIELYIAKGKGKHKGKHKDNAHGQEGPGHEQDAVAEAKGQAQSKGAKAQGKGKRCGSGRGTGPP